MKDALHSQIQQEESAIQDPLDVKKQQLQQQITLLDNYTSPNDSTSTTATEQPSSEAISEAHSTKKPLCRSKCRLLKTTPNMLKWHSDLTDP